MKQQITLTIDVTPTLRSEAKRERRTLEAQAEIFYRRGIYGEYFCDAEIRLTNDGSNVRVEIKGDLDTIKRFLQSMSPSNANFEESGSNEIEKRP